MGGRGRPTADCGVEQISLNRSRRHPAGISPRRDVDPEIPPGSSPPAAIAVMTSSEFGGCCQRWQVLPAASISDLAR